MILLTGKVLFALLGALVVGFIAGWYIRGRLSARHATHTPPNTFFSSHDTVPGKSLAQMSTLQRTPMTPSEALQMIKEKRDETQKKENEKEGNAGASSVSP